MKTVLINPNLVALRKDFFTTGIVYMPIGLAYKAASLRKSGKEIVVIDAFGEKPRQARKTKDFLFLGLSRQEIVERLPSNATNVIVYANHLTNHLSIIEIVRSIRQAYPNLPISVLENTQAVTAYSLSRVADEFYEAGANNLLTGEAYDGSTYPAWDLFPIANYWKLRFAHGPQSSKRYLPLLTSRGCPFNCKFCLAPALTDRKWQARPAQDVVDEIESHLKVFNVSEFHIEDLNPTVSEDRFRDISNEILKRKLKVTWKIVSGTKAESIGEETIDLMAKAGCHYISISPETGSPELLKKMGKPFDFDHAIKIIKRMNKVGISSQACFVLGFPGETNEDLKMTDDFVRKLTRIGIDEIALFIISPVPGAQIYEQFYGFKSLSELNFSPSWRKDYVFLNSFRLKLYLKFILWKIIYHPLKVLRQIFNFLTRRFATKMEMVPYRAFVFKWLDMI